MLGVGHWSTFQEKIKKHLSPHPGPPCARALSPPRPPEIPKSSPPHRPDSVLAFGLRAPRDGPSVARVGAIGVRYHQLRRWSGETRKTPFIINALEGVALYCKSLFGLLEKTPLNNAFEGVVLLLWY